MTRAILLCFLFLAACTHQEELVLEEPIIEEELADIGPTDCPTGDDDGIGGTGCEPVARDATIFVIP